MRIAIGIIIGLFVLTGMAMLFYFIRKSKDASAGTTPDGTNGISPPPPPPPPPCIPYTQQQQELDIKTCVSKCSPTALGICVQNCINNAKPVKNC